MAQVVLDGPPPRAKSYEDCLRKCDQCGIGASNAANSEKVTYIYQHPLDNIPVEARKGVDTALDTALNIRNRPSKRQRFGFSTSEDAVTWVVFTYLLRSAQLFPVLKKIGLADKSVTTNPALLLWGAPVDSNGKGEVIRQKLEEICTSLGESPQSFSEPDVIIDLDDSGMIFIEVKYLSGNDIKLPDYPGWKRYLQAESLTWDEQEVVNSGCYELARNWRILKSLAGKRPATLVNLGLPSLLSGSGDDCLKRFEAALGADPTSKFARLSWANFLSEIDEKPGWFRDFCKNRGLDH